MTLNERLQGRNWPHELTCAEAVLVKNHRALDRQRQAQLEICSFALERAARAQPSPQPAAAEHRDCA